MAGDVLLFDVKPQGEDKAFLVFDKVAAVLGKIIKSSETATKVLDAVHAVSNPQRGVALAKLATGREDVDPSFIGPVQPKKAKGEASPVGMIGKVMSGIAAAAAPVGAAFAALGNAAMGTVKAFGELADKLDQYVKYINPAASQRFQIAMEDLYATIGEKLLPIFEPMITLVEKFADALSEITASGLFRALGELLSKVGGALISVFKFLTPIINAVIWVFEKLIDAINWVIDKLKSTTTVFEERVRERLANPEGLTEQQKRELQALLPAGTEGGRARAARGISVTGLESISSRALEAAGNIGQRSAADRTAENTDAIRRILELIPSIADDEARLRAMAGAEREV